MGAQFPVFYSGILENFQTVFGFNCQYLLDIAVQEKDIIGLYSGSSWPGDCLRSPQEIGQFYFSLFTYFALFPCLAD